MKSIAKMNFWTDVILLVAFLVSCGAGLVLWFGFPYRMNGIGADFWGLTHHSWKNLHIYASVIFLAQATIHISLHWTWIKTVAVRFMHRTSAQARRNFVLAILMFGLFLLTVGCGLFLWLAPEDSALYTLTNREIWFELHQAAGMSLIVLTQVHIIFHWKWLRMQLRSLFRSGGLLLEASKPLQRA